MDRVYQSNAIETPPSSVASSGSYPTAGNKASGQLATVPGPYWFYSITEEIRNAIIAAGLTPDSAQVNQLAAAMAKFLPLSGGTLTGKITSTSERVMDSTNTGGIFIVADANVSSTKTGCISVFPVTHSQSNRNGGFQLVASDGSNNKTLTGHYTNGLKWDGKDVVCVGSWTSGTSWYRKYSDGWIEQGGRASNNGTNLTFPTAFTNAPLVVHVQSNRNTTSAAATNASSVTATGMRVNADVSAGDSWWYVAGY